MPRMWRTAYLEGVRYPVRPGLTSRFNVPVLVEDKLEGLKGELLLKKGGEFVLDGAGPGADQNHEAVHTPRDTTAWGSSVVTRELFLLPDLFVRFRINDEWQAVTGGRLNLSLRHLLLPDTEK